MSARNVFKMSAGVGGIAADRALVEGAGEIMEFVDKAQPRSYSLEAALGMQPSFNM